MGKNVHCVNLASYSSKTVVTLLKFYGILQKGRFRAKKSRRILGTQVSTWFEFRRKSILSWLVDSNYSSISEFSIADYCHFCWTYLYLYQSLVPYQIGSQIQWFRCSLYAIDYRVHHGKVGFWNWMTGRKSASQILF